MKLITTLFFLFWGLNGFQTTYAQDISGEWNGVLLQEKGGISDKYYFSLHIIQKGSVITGFSKVELYEGSKRILYVRKRIEGSFVGRTLAFKEVEILDIDNLSTDNICLITGKLQFVWDKSSLCLKGTWGGQTDSGTICAPGTIKVCSTIPVAAQ